MNYFESTSTETEQLQQEQKETLLDTTSRVKTANSDIKPEAEHPSEELMPDERVQADSLSQIPSDLSYACLLIPRFSDHHLAGDITQLLPIWMKEICVSFGWRLETMIVRPGYIQWVITVPMEANPAQIMRVTRQQTSLKILNEFPRYKRQNLSGDFWAPGFTLTSGNKLQSPETISNFIQVTRKQQGIY